MTKTAERIAQGNIVGVVASTRRRDEVGRLQESFQQMTRRLQQMAGSARKIAEGNLDLTIIPQSAEEISAMHSRV